MSKQKVYIESTEFQPKNEFILVKPEELKTEETTSSGLVISLNKNNRALDRPTSGRVIAVGKDIEDIPVGTFVFWPTTDGIDFEFNDGDFMLLRYASILGSKKE